MRHSGTSSSTDSASESDNEYVCRYTQAGAAGNLHLNGNNYANYPTSTNGVYNVVQKYYQTPYNTQQGYDNYAYQTQQQQQQQQQQQNYAYLPNYYTPYGHLQPQSVQQQAQTQAQQYQTIPRNAKNAQILSVRYLVQPSSTPKYPKVTPKYYEYQQQKNFSLPYHTNPYNYSYMNALMQQQQQLQQQQQQQQQHQQQQQQRVNFSAGSSTATTLYNDHKTFEYPHDVPTYEMSQKQQQINKVGSIESNLRFLSMGGIGGSANLNTRNDDFNTQNMDNEEQKIRNNIVKTNYLDVNIVEPRKRVCTMKKALITTGVLIVIVAVILGLAIGLVYRDRSSKMSKVDGKQLVFDGSNITNFENAFNFTQSLNETAQTTVLLSHSEEIITTLHPTTPLEARILNTKNISIELIPSTTTTSTTATGETSETIPSTLPTLTSDTTTMTNMTTTTLPSTTTTTTTETTTTTHTTTTTPTTPTTPITTTTLETKLTEMNNTVVTPIPKSMFVITHTIKFNDTLQTKPILQEKKSPFMRKMKTFH